MALSFVPICMPASWVSGRTQQNHKGPPSDSCSVFGTTAATSPLFQSYCSRSRPLRERASTSQDEPVRLAERPLSLQDLWVARAALLPLECGLNFRAPVLVESVDVFLPSAISIFHAVICRLSYLALHWNRRRLRACAGRPQVRLGGGSHHLDAFRCNHLIMINQSSK